MFFKKAPLFESQIFGVWKLKPIFQNACFYLARAGVAMSVWTAMDMGTPPQWMLPRVSFSAMLYLGVSMFNTFPSDVNIFHLHPRSYHLLEVQSHAPVLHGLVNAQQTSIPKLFEHLDSFCIWWPCLIKSSPLLLGTSPPPPIGWQMGWCPEQSWLRSKLSWVYLDSNFTSSTILWAVFCISLCSSPKKLSCKRICEVHFEKWCKNAAMLKFLRCVTREV